MELKAESYHDWLWIPMLLLLCLAAFLFTKYNDQVKRYFFAIVSNREFNDLVRDESQVSKRASLALNIFSLFSYSMMIFLFASKYYHTDLTNLELYFAVNAFLFGGFLLKFLFIYFLGELFQAQNSTDLYIRNSLLGNKVSGVILFPLALIVAYSQDLVGFFFCSSIIIWLLTSFFKWYKGIKFGLSLSELPKIYPFLYICTLEILPTILLLKIFLEPLKKIVPF